MRHTWLIDINPFWFNVVNWIEHHIGHWLGFPIVMNRNKTNLFILVHLYILNTIISLVDIFATLNSVFDQIGQSYIRLDWRVMTMCVSLQGNSWPLHSSTPHQLHHSSSLSSVCMYGWAEGWTLAISIPLIVQINLISAHDECMCECECQIERLMAIIPRCSSLVCEQCAREEAMFTQVLLRLRIPPPFTVVEPRLGSRSTLADFIYTLHACWHSHLPTHSDRDRERVSEQTKICVINSSIPIHEELHSVDQDTIECHIYVRGLIWH